MTSTTERAARRANLMILCAGLIFALTLGIRNAQALFISPINTSTGLGLASISFAFGVGQLVWGLTQPIGGVLSTRYGNGPVLVLGGLMVAAGTALTPYASSTWALVLTVGLLGERRPRVLPPMEIVFLDASDPTPVYSFEMKQESSQRIRYEVPARLSEREQERVERAARECFGALGCRDVARLDFRMDSQGRVFFIESNPLPGLAPGWSDLVLIAQAAGISYRELIGEILSFAIRRHQERERERERARRAAAREAAGGNGARREPPGPDAADES